MITAVDTNILLDVLIPDAPAGEESQDLLDDTLQQGELVISEVVYAELAAHFLTAQELEQFVDATGLRLSSSQPEALARAGQAWVSYLRRGGGTLRCSACGRSHFSELKNLTFIFNYLPC